MFKVGDKIVYPPHGAGVIESIETKEILGDQKDYYIINMPIGDLEISVPVDKVEEVGIREVFNVDETESIITVLEGKSTSMPDNWNKRYRENLDKIKTGDVYEIARVVRNLVIRDEDKGLSTYEKKMLNSAKKMLVSEFVLVNDISEDEATKKIDDAILNFL